MKIHILAGATALLIAAPAAAQQTTECRTDWQGVTRCTTQQQQGMNIDWGLLNRGPDIGERFRRGMDDGRRMSQEAWEHQQRMRAAEEQQAAARQLRLNAEAAAARAQREAEQRAAQEQQQKLTAGVTLSCTMDRLDGPLKQLGVALFERESKARVTHAGNTFMVDAAFTPDTVSWNVGEFNTTISRLDLSLVFGPTNTKSLGL